MFDRFSFIRDSLQESSQVKERILSECLTDINLFADKVISSLKSGGKILLCGNGGSAADCQHIATELVVRLSHDLNRPAIAAIAITTDTSNLTAGGNDIGFENIFARSVEALGKTGDVLFCISTSGNSPNILKAIHQAKSTGMVIAGLSGDTGGKMLPLCDVCIKIPSRNVQRIQEGHITVAHILCEIIEREMYPTG
ncbi:MAG: SIS domain-containing protein [Ignavibacteriaceae bacterium]|jgi:D-sedoheptulose 7-phosphate isomerase|nr:MAG: SIS domain-containing protein [Chlorobiota bacterium]KXK02447.1 MAG: phosphoheptose isomerase [Chlorobi bacterium OLB4]MBV6398043.1 Phosphoheptose isomerase [Ignavibacteria bacterium]MCC6886491.1 SIS domain-containing protein [Ignavibacteriales bacterium]MCE7952433.1 SIS domain-containing protein [Chlorobi bacterium CHB7]MDL1886550.1 SIS domain-containing protein [Ignavibacteria bacterium CHB1]MEB2329732.1 SIS domain-containing protein [Ignavibacteriaceae bacterium]OQY77350.1 MAG: ph